MTTKDLFDFTLKLLNMGGHIKSLVYFFRSHYMFTLPNRNKILIDSPKKDKCYIIGLGPSLNQVDLNKIDGDSIVVNRFFKAGERWPNFVPTYYLIADKGFLSTKFKDDFIEVLNTYKDKETKYILNSYYSKGDVIKDDPQNKIFYFSAFNGSFSSNKKIRIDKVMPSFGNVVCNAIAFAMGLGYKKIILLGCDFNSFASRKPEHFYSESTIRSISMEDELFAYANVAHMHMELQKYAKNNDISIINSTKGSLIDAYPYIIDEDLYYQS